MTSGAQHALVICLTVQSCGARERKCLRVVVICFASAQSLAYTLEQGILPSAKLSLGCV